MSCWYSLDSSHQVLSDEYPCARISIIFQIFLHYFVLAKLATSNIRVHGKHVYDKMIKVIDYKAHEKTYREEKNLWREIDNRSQLFLLGLKSYDVTTQRNSSPYCNIS